MVIIGFSGKTSKILPRIFCRRFRHVAVIVPTASGFIMYQFMRRAHIAKIALHARDIGILKRHGWVFIELPNTAPMGLEYNRAFTCVQLAKYSIGMQKISIQTPNALYKRLQALEF